VAGFDPLSHLPSGVQLGFFASGAYRAAPACTFAFDDIQEAHRLMESDCANGKIVVRLGG
jgi:NADPH2:quinone reductase